MERRPFLKYLSLLIPVMGSEHLAARRGTIAFAGCGAQPTPEGTYGPGREHSDTKLQQEAKKIAGIAAEMRPLIERWLKTALAKRNPRMKQAGITPFTPFDTNRKPTDLTSYENHRFMMDWWTSD